MLSACTKEVITSPTLLIDGAVTNAITGAPVPGAKVELCYYSVTSHLFGSADSVKTTLAEVITDSNGWYNLEKGADDSRYTVIVTKEFMRTAAFYVTYKENGRHDVNLHP
jgi:hypothetical protein